MGALALSMGLVASGCASSNPTSSSSASGSASASAAASQAPIVEGAGATSRIALSYDGGIMVIDAKDMKVLDDIKAEGFLRLSDAGDNRHLVVADGNSYTFLDTGIWSVAHGDHSHYYRTAPSLSSLKIEADHTGHVIADNGRVAAFADGTGSFAVYDPADLVQDKRTASHLETTVTKLAQPHHGFAIPLENDQYLVAVGDSKTRTGAAVVDKNGTVVVENSQCPGVHGEAIAANKTFTVGCTDGALIYKNGAFTKITNPENPYSRSGNQAGHPDSPYVLADYKTDKDAKLERPEKFAIIDTLSNERRVYSLPAGVSYTFRSLARGPKAEALLLTTDGKLRIFDPATGAQLSELAIMDSWSESETWQDPRPAIWVDGKIAYVTDPATKKLHAISLADVNAPKLQLSMDLPHVPNEINGVTSSKAAPVEAHAH